MKVVSDGQYVLIYPSVRVTSVGNSKRARAVEEYVEKYAAWSNDTEGCSWDPEEERERGDPPPRAHH